MEINQQDLFILEKNLSHWHGLQQQQFAINLANHRIMTSIKLGFSTAAIGYINILIGDFDDFEGAKLWSFLITQLLFLCSIILLFFFLFWQKDESNFQTIDSDNLYFEFLDLLQDYPELSETKIMDLRGKLKLYKNYNEHSNVRKRRYSLFSTSVFLLAIISFIVSHLIAYCK